MISASIQLANHLLVIVGRTCQRSQSFLTQPSLAAVGGASQGAPDVPIYLSIHNTSFFLRGALQVIALGPAEQPRRP